MVVQDMLDMKENKENSNYAANEKKAMMNHVKKMNTMVVDENAISKVIDSQKTQMSKSKTMYGQDLLGIVGDSVKEKVVYFQQ